jgi:hypothetical protein
VLEKVSLVTVEGASVLTQNGDLANTTVEGLGHCRICQSLAQIDYTRNEECLPSLAPFLDCLTCVACWRTSRIS